MNWRYPTMTQTQLGQLFGVSCQDIGKWLTNAGLRDNKGKPTALAHDENLCKQIPSGPAGYYWAWNTGKSVKLLQENGHQLSDVLPESLVEPTFLNGPFEQCGKRVNNADGSVAAVTSNAINARAITKLLNMAHKTGAIDRLLTTKTIISGCDNTQAG